MPLAELRSPDPLGVTLDWLNSKLGNAQERVHELEDCTLANFCICSNRNKKCERNKATLNKERARFHRVPGVA